MTVNKRHFRRGGRVTGGCGRYQDRTPAESAADPIGTGRTNWVHAMCARGARSGPLLGAFSLGLDARPHTAALRRFFEVWVPIRSCPRLDRMAFPNPAFPSSEEDKPTRIP